MTKTESDSISLFVQCIIHSSKYRNHPILEETIRDVFTQELEKNPDIKEARNQARKKLHNISAFYLGDPDYSKAFDELKIRKQQNNFAKFKEACLEIMATHSSTRERIPNLSQILILAACAPAGTPAQDQPAASSTPALGKDPQNATYIIDGQPVTLVNGVAEQETATGSASKKVTRYFGNAVDVDLNSDGAMDSGFLLTQEGGGSGTFFYVAAALNQDNGYLGTNAILLGDRIAPQSTNVDPNNPAQFIVNYAERVPGEPMSAQPTQGVSKTFKFDNGMLVEVPR